MSYLTPNQNKKSGVSYRHSYSQGIAVVCLCVGLALTAYMYNYFVQIDNERVHQRLLRGTQVLASTIEVTPIAPDTLTGLEVLVKLSQDLVLNPQIDNEMLNAYLWEPADPITTTLSIRYLPKVNFNPFNQQYEMVDLSGQMRPFDIPIRNFVPDGTTEEITFGINDEYYPVAIATGESIAFDIIGLNFFSESSFHLAFDQARDSGIFTSRVSFPQRNENEPYVLSFLFQPLYSGASLPESVAERRERHVGFLSIGIFTLAESFIDFLPESYQGMDVVFFTDSEGFASDNLNPKLQSKFDAGDFGMASYQADGLENHMVTQASNAQILSLHTSDRWWALSIGLLLTLWVSSMLYNGSRRSLKMQSLVLTKTSDLAERSKKLEELNATLEKTESLYRMVATNVNDIIHISDTNGICTYISPSVKIQLGYDIEDFLGYPIDRFMTEISKKAFNNVMEKANSGHRENDRHSMYEYEIYDKEGSVVIMESTRSVLFDENQNTTGFLVVSRDITERKNSQEENLKLEQTIQQTQKMDAIGTLAGGIAHDFNNLLTGILGHAQLINFNDRDNESNNKSINVIETAALRGKELTSQLLGFARKGQFRKKLVNINELVSETEMLIERTMGKNINILCKYSDENPTISGDPGQINQILLNMAVNARDAMPDGGKLIFETSVKEFYENDTHMNLDPGKYCVISVSDTGMGIEKNTIDRIFEPFFSDKDEGKGTGLGLAMVYGVVKNHGGRVSVYSEVGVGTVFTVHLPLSDTDAEKKQHEESIESLNCSGKVLIVDDEELVRELASIMLQRLGYETVTAVDGLKALEFYEQHWQDIDFILMDLVMPNMGGLECLQKMREVNPKLKALLSTGYTADSINENLNEDYILGFLQKPFMLKDLAEQVGVGIKASRKNSIA